MRHLILMAILAGPAMGLTVGESYDQVIEEKGQPSGRMGVGTLMVLNYPDAIVKLRDGAVIDIGAAGKARLTTTVAQAPVQAQAAVAPIPADFDGHATWETNFDTALSQARDNKRHVLILFTGSDWCPWCRKMEADVYSKPQFASYSHDSWVLLKLDFLRHSAVPGEQKLEQIALQKRYNISGFPTAVIVDSSGRELKRFVGYVQGGADSFVSQLKSVE